MTQVHVSVTGLRLRRIWHAPRFWRHAVRAMSAARTAPGNLSVSARTIGGVHHTLSVWENEAAMQVYLRSPAHRDAMRAFPAIATGRTLGYAAAAAPTWDEALVRWETEAKSYG